MVKSLCEKYSPPLLSMPPPLAVTSSLAKSSIDSAEERELESFHPFPPPSRLAAADVSATLRSLGFGYRAEYIQKTAKMLVDQHEGSSTSSDAQEAAELWLITLRKLPTSQVRAELLKLMGVGRKVADCVLLMSMDKVRLSDDLATRYSFLTGSLLERSDTRRHTRSPNRHEAL